MPFWGRAKFNHLQMQTIETLRKGEKDIPADWKIWEYHKLSFTELFSILHTLDIVWDAEFFVQEAQKYSSPEEIAYSLDLSKEDQEKAYLCIFELWKRLLDDQETISIFCNELDWAIFFYDKTDRNSQETVRLMLQDLLDIFDFNRENSKKPKTIFQEVSYYLAQDLEEFLYRYIRDLIVEEGELAASELLDYYMPYVEGNLWFDFLHLQTVKGAPSEEITAIISRFMEKLRECSDVELFLTFLCYLLETGKKDVFLHVYQEVLEKIKTEKHFCEMLDIIFAFYKIHDVEKGLQAVYEMKKQSQSKKDTQKVSSIAKKKLSKLLQTAI